MKRAAVAAAISSVMFLSACGSSDGGSLLSPASNTTAPATTSAPAATETGAPTDTAPTDAAPTDTGAATTTGPAATQPATGDSGTGAQPANAKAYNDPEGKYRISINKRWIPISSKAIKAEAWYVDAPDGDFRPYVNVFTEDLTGAAAGISPVTYLRLSVTNLKKAGFTVVRQSTVAGVNTPMLGAIEYTGAPPGAGGKRHFLAIIDVSQNGAAVVTLSSAMNTFTQHRTAALPYMLTVVSL